MVKRGGNVVATMLWLPLPFYVYSISYGSVPIFIPQLYPHSFYNSRYGMEMLPALALFGGVAAEWAARWMKTRQPLVARFDAAGGDGADCVEHGADGPRDAAGVEGGDGELGGAHGD